MSARLREGKSITWGLHMGLSHHIFRSKAARFKLGERALAGLLAFALFALSLGGLTRPMPAAAAVRQTDARLSAGAHHSLAIKPDGSLWAWGHNGSGQLGDGTTAGQFYPKRIGTATDWARVAAGTNHTLAIRTDGSLWAWGYNSYGQLGDSTTALRTKPVKIDGGSEVGWATVAAGSDFSLAIKSDGSLWAWGRNVAGQLGDGTSSTRYLPMRIGSANDWAAVSAGTSHSLAIKTDGSLWAWGFNYHGQLGDGTSNSRLSPTRIGSATDWATVSAGGFHSLAIKSDGSLWAWGSNSYGQLGDTTIVSKASPTRIGSATDWATVSAGGYPSDAQSQHSLATKNDGSLWAWGSNAGGQLGDDDVPTRALTPVKLSTGWSTVSAGGYHSLGRKTAGTHWAWGSNSSGQLGTGGASTSRTPTQVSLVAGTGDEPVAGDGATSGSKSDRPVIVFVGGLGEKCTDSNANKLFGFMRSYYEDAYHVAIAPSSPGATASDVIDSTGNYIAAADRLDRFLKSKFPGRKIVLVGHSMGGLISRAYAEHWRGFDSKCEPLAIVQLGTPNAGSPLAALRLLWPFDQKDAHYGLQAGGPTIKWFNSAYTNSRKVPVYQVAGYYFPVQATFDTYPKEWHKLATIGVLNGAFLLAPNDGAVSVSSVQAYPKNGVVERRTAPLIHTWENDQLKWWKSAASHVVPQRSHDTQESRTLSVVTRAVQNAEAGICPTPLTTTASLGVSSAGELRSLSSGLSLGETLNAAEPWFTLAEGTMAITNDGWSEVPLMVEDGMVQASLSGLSAQPSVVLEGSGGEVVPSALSFNPDTQVAMFIAGELAPGAYSLKIRGADGTQPSDIAYSIIEAGPTSLRVVAPETAVSGTPFVMTAAVVESEALRKGILVDARVGNGPSVTMKDDGITPDAVANDGVYTSTLTATDPGVATVVVGAKGVNSAGRAFQRQAISLVGVTRPRASFNGDYAVRQVTGTSGKVTALAVDVGVAAAEAASLTVNADISTGDGATVVAQGGAQLQMGQAGSGTATITFPVADLVGGLPANGAYRLTSATLVDRTDGIDAVLAKTNPNRTGSLTNPDYVGMTVSVRGGNPSIRPVTTLDGDAMVTTQLIEGVEVSIDGGQTWRAVAEPETGWSKNQAAWSWAVELPDGEYVATARALGSSGPITGTQRTVSFKVEILNAPDVAPTLSAPTTVSSPTANVTWGAVARAAGYQWRLGETGQWNDVGSASADISGLEPGANTLFVRAINAAGSGPTASAVITRLVPVTGVTVVLGPVKLGAAGQTSKATASVVPSNATDASVNWSSSNPAVATVSSSGVVTAKGPGVSTIRATARDGSGKSGAAQLTVTVPTSVTLVAPGIRNDGTSSLNGVLKSGGIALPGRWVTIQRSVDAGRTWSDLVRVKTGSGGAWSHAYNPSAGFERNHELRVLYGGETGYLASTTKTALQVRAGIGGLKKSTKTPKAKRAFTLTATLKPQFKSGTYPVVAQFQKQQSNGSYKTVKTVKMKASNYSTYTKLTAKTSLSSKGSYRVRIYHSGVAKSSKGYSFTKGYSSFHRFKVN